jgi:hypothetical protein
VRSASVRASRRDPHGGGEEVGHLDIQFIERAFAGSWCGSDEQLPGREQRALAARRGAQQLAQAATEPVADDGRSDRAADGEGDPGRDHVGVAQVPAPQRRRAGAAAMTGQSLELASLTDAADQAESRARPLSRRALMIERPARVRIRARKPCLRARRRVFGW